MSSQNSKVDAFVSRRKAWGAEIQKLRSVLIDCGLDEELKWGKPCYAFEGKNIAIIQPFKEHCALMFFKGALLEDKHKLLRSQGQNTQSALRLEFTSAAQIRKAVVQSYVKQAIAVEKAGTKVDFKAKRELELPEELTRMLEKDRKLAKRSTRSRRDDSAGTSFTSRAQSSRRHGPRGSRSAFPKSSQAEA